MGSISDRFQSRLGRRRPFIALGALILAITLVCVFNPPQLETQAEKFIYLLLSYLALNTASTIIAIPHSALGAELTPNRDEITEIYAWRLLSGNVGMILGTVVPGLFLIKASTSQPVSPGFTSGTISPLPYTYAAIALGVLICLTATITFFSTKKYDKSCINKDNTSKIANLRDSFRVIAKNRPFVLLFVAYVIATIGTSINSSFAFYFYRYRLLLSEDQTQKIIAAFVIVFTAALLSWIGLSKRFDKAKLLVVGTGSLGLMTVILYPLFPAQDLTGPFIAALLGGIFVGSVLLLDALLIDCIDYDEVYSRENRPGIYFGLWKMGSKVARAAAVALSGYMLSAIGFQSNVTQSPDVSRAIAMVFGPGVGAFFLVAASLMIKFKLSSKKIQQVRTIIAKRRSLNAYGDK